MINTSFLAYSKPSAEKPVHFGNESGNGANVNVSRVTSADSPKFDDYVRFFNKKLSSSPGTYTQKYYDPSRVRPYLERNVSDPFTSRFIAYDDKGRTAGLIDAHLSPWSYYIEELHVDDRYEGSQKVKIAQQLMANAKADAKANGMDSILMQALSPEQVQFYESVGFESGKPKPTLNIKA
jgi:hypothetical protein